jgi:putative membrane protein
MSKPARVAHVGRGALIGTAEAVPGVSGGTVALVTGVYEVIISSAGHLVSAGRLLFTDRGRARAELREVRWDVLLPLALGMLPALVIALLLLGPAVEDHPVPTRALFLGLVAAALVAPVSMLGSRWRATEIGVAVLAAGVAFVLTGMPEREFEPTLPVVFLTAAVAVCALVLPGVSGSFLLLALGLYVPTSEALRDLDLAYIGVFVLGAATGLSVVVKGLQWLLEHRHRITLAAMTGLIIGAMRALWPWQTEDRELQAPEGQVALAIGLFLLGVALVLSVFLVERRAAARDATRGAIRDDHEVGHTGSRSAGT